MKFIYSLVLILFSLSFSFSFSQVYDQKYQDMAIRENTPVGVVVVAYNRPSYFLQVIKSIEENPEAAHLPFFFMLDGGPLAEQEENTKMIQASSIAHKEIILRERNYGCAKNLIDARRFMFDWCKFEKIIVMEDDLVITPQYLGLLLRLHQWAKENYDNVGVVQAWTSCLLNYEEKKQRLNEVVGGGAFWWSFVSYCIDQETWAMMSPILYEYESRFIDAIPQTEEFFKQRSKPNLSDKVEEIRQWIWELINDRPMKSFVDQRTFKTKRLNYESIFTNKLFEPNQDHMTGFALWMAGLIKIQTVVNRAKHIGEVGLTCDNKSFKAHKFDKIILDGFEEDHELTSFKEKY